MMPARLSPGMLADLPQAVARPGYDRGSVTAGIAHIGVGAFHRCHQAEYTDDLLALDCAAHGHSPWGITGINIRPPLLAPSLGAQGGLYTRLMLRDAQAAPRVIGSILSVVDSQAGPEPALAVLADPAIRVVTMTATEKSYCHRPADGSLQTDHPDIAHDLARPEVPRSLPGLLVAALARRRASGAGPLTLISCDNIPSNGAILHRVVTGLARARDAALADWIEAHAAFPGAMVDRIAPAVTAADRDRVAAYGYADQAVVVSETFRQWVIEDRFAGAMPDWGRVGAQIVADVEPFEILKMRVLNGAQSAICTLGALFGLEHTCDDMADPVLAGFVQAMLLDETVPTLRPVPGTAPRAYVAESLERLRNTAIRHRNHQIATDGSQKIVQRLLNPMAERRAAGLAVPLLSVAVAGWMAYLIRASRRFGAAWVADDPYAGRIAAIAEAAGDDPAALVAAITRLDGIFAPALSADPEVTGALTGALTGLLSADPQGYLGKVMSQRLSREAGAP